MLRYAALPLLIAVAACAEPIDEQTMAEAEAPVTPVPITPEPDPSDAMGEADGGSVVPSLAEVQTALASCTVANDVIESECEASEDGAQYTCTYSLDGDTPETEREALIARNGDTFTLVEIPDDCDPQ